MAEQSTKRPFWMHQLVEYILGIALIAAGTQSPTPAVPALVGLAIILWAACTKSSIAAFRVIPRSAHKWGDPVLVLLIVIAAIQPWADVDFNSRGVMLLIAFCEGFIWLHSSYTDRAAERAARKAAKESAVATAMATPPKEDVATDIGRKAGRAAASGVNAIKKWAK